MKKASLLMVAGLLVFSGMTVQADSHEEEQSYGPEKWQQYRLDTSNNAVFDNGDERTIRQAYHTGDEVRTNPVIAGDNLYVGNHGSGKLYSFDLFTGEENWSTELPNWIHEDSIYVDGKVYVGYGNRNFPDPFKKKIRGTGKSGAAAFDGKTGEKIWNFETEGEVMPAPAYHEGTIYIATGDQTLYALDAESGELQWNLKLPGYVSMSAPHISDGMLYVGATDNLVAVDLENQRIAWKEGKLGSVTDVPPAVSNDVVIVTGAKFHTELNKKELYEKYGDTMPDMHFKIKEGERKKIGIDDENYHFIYAFDKKSGELLWQDLMGTGPDQEVPIPHINTSGAVTIEGDYAYVGSPYTKSVHAYHIPTGENVWEYNNKTPVKGAPAVKDGLVFFGDAEGDLYVLEAETGALVSQTEVGGALLPGGPVIINETLFVGSQDSNVYAFPLSDLN